MAPSVPRFPLRVTNASPANNFYVYGAHRYKVSLDTLTVTPTPTVSDNAAMMKYIHAVGFKNAYGDTGTNIIADYVEVWQQFNDQPAHQSRLQQLANDSVGDATTPILGPDGRGVIGQSTKDAAGDIADATGISNLFGLFTSATFWERAGEVTVGVIIVAVGLNAVVKSATGADAGKAALNLTPIGRTARAARRSDKVFAQRQAQRRSVFEENAAHYDNMTEKHAERAFRTSYSRGVGRKAGNA